MSSMKYESKERGEEGLTNAKDLPMVLPEGRESPCHRLDKLTNYHNIRGLKVFSRCKDVVKDRNTRGTFSMDCREQGSQARRVYPTQYTSRMGTARMKEQTQEY